MNSAIYKYQIPISDDPTEITLPRGADILSCGEAPGMRNTLFLWANVDLDTKETEKLNVLAEATGRKLSMPSYAKFIGTMVRAGDVWHVFAWGEKPWTQ